MNVIHEKRGHTQAFTHIHPPTIFPLNNLFFIRIARIYIRAYICMHVSLSVLLCVCAVMLGCAKKMMLHVASSSITHLGWEQSNCFLRPLLIQMAGICKLELQLSM